MALLPLYLSLRHDFAPLLDCWIRSAYSITCIVLLYSVVAAQQILSELSETFGWTLAFHRLPFLDNVLVTVSEGRYIYIGMYFVTVKPVAFYLL